jgi:hypothetical protein
VFDKRVLRNVSEPKRDEVTGGWREMHDEELCRFYPSPSNQIHVYKMNSASVTLKRDEKCTENVGWKA